MATLRRQFVSAMHCMFLDQTEANFRFLTSIGRAVRSIPTTISIYSANLKVLRRAKPVAIEEDAKELDLSRSRSIFWLLEVSTDPKIRLDTLLLLPQSDWTLDALRENLSVDMLDFLLDHLVRCFEKGTDGMHLMTSKEEQAVQICDAFLFVYWELHILDVRTATCWILGPGRSFAQSHHEILDCLMLPFTQSDRKAKHLPLHLMFLTIRSHVDELWHYVKSIAPRLGELQPKSDELWSTLQRKRTTSTVPVTGPSRFARPRLHLHTLILMSQISRRDKWGLSNNLEQLRNVIAHCCELGPSATEHIITCSVAFATTLGYELKGDASLGIITTPKQVSISAAHAILEGIPREIEEYEQNEEDACHLVHSGLAVLTANIRLLVSLRTPDIANHLLKLCTWMYDRLVNQRYAAQWVRTLAGFLRLVIYAVSTTEFPYHLSPEGWCPDPAHLKWLPTFLQKLSSLSGEQSGTLGEDEVHHAAADTFLLLARGGSIGLISEDGLFATFDWVIGLSFPAEWPPNIKQIPLFRLQMAMIGVVDALIRIPGHLPPDFISQLRTRIVSSLPNVVTHPTQSLSKSESENFKAIYERDKAFIDTLLSLTPQSSDRESWLNDSVNDAYVRAWAHIVHRWLIPDPDDPVSRVHDFSLASLLACTKLCQATAADWGDDLACIQRVAVVAVWHEWFAWYWTDKAPEDLDALVERTRIVMKLDARSAVGVGAYVSELRYYMTRIRKDYPSHVEGLHFPDLISTVEGREAEIKELKNWALPAATSPGILTQGQRLR
ncbi:hypothetical protein EIP91_004440 [Steccherinum ochraceum]|uniref:Uncharacterized protein n=1 Tax=Steccherinum ochraceum TaxID=92696 RepID=A0A4R0RBE6_9APHY|nr:hypothetical protein EIP91_004440 [Steccherinum ochraceum]